MVHFKLSNAHEIPAPGFGTWRSKPGDAYRSVKHALDIGYRHIDGAEVYGNEEDLGRAIRDSSAKRDEVFLTTKLWNTHWSAEDTTVALEASLAKFATDYLDLYLVHWPGPPGRVAEVWPALEKAVDDGKVTSIGVSNFPIHRITSLLEHARIPPVVNQVECHPELQNTVLADFCADNGMLLEAYAPLNSDRIGELLEDKTLKRIASIHNKTVPQVVLRWHIQRGIVPLPKSVTETRIEENFDLFDFELSDEEMKGIRRLNKGARHFPDPDDAEFGFPRA